ncbi:hypothetical protein [Leptolyngbya sp. FACHB-321]|nr:hypothetical protein [Leptolyngbya sp. FACHB-321]
MPPNRDLLRYCEFCHWASDRKDNWILGRPDGHPRLSDLNL